MRVKGGKDRREREIEKEKERRESYKLGLVSV